MDKDHSPDFWTNESIQDFFQIELIFNELNKQKYIVNYYKTYSQFITVLHVRIHGRGRGRGSTWL